MTVNAFTAHVLTTHDLKHMVTMLLVPYPIFPMGSGVEETVKSVTDRICGQ